MKSPHDETHDYILSSADFGRAYLSQAWATEFVRSLLENFTVVLLGYQAEDPPIKYLLQGLHHHNTVILLILIDRLELDRAQGIPEKFKKRLNNLLCLPSIKSENTIAKITHNLPWLSYIDPNWVNEKIINFFSLDNTKAQAAWDGYLTSHKPWLREGFAEQIYPLITELFPTIYDNEWDKHLSNKAAVILVELTLNRTEEDWRISFKDMRHCLRHMTIRNIQHVINRLGVISQDNPSNWEKMVIPFIQQAWPKEKSFQKIELTTSWLSLLEYSENAFPKMVQTVLPFLTRYKSYVYFYPFFHSKNEVPLAQLFPKDALDLLDKLIMDTPDIIPYEVSKILNIVIETDPSLLNSAKYKRLIAIIESG